MNLTLYWLLMALDRRRALNRALDELAARIRDPRRYAVPSPVALTVYAETDVEVVNIPVGGSQ